MIFASSVCGRARTNAPRRAYDGPRDRHIIIIRSVPRFVSFFRDFVRVRVGRRSIYYIARRFDSAKSLPGVHPCAVGRAKKKLQGNNSVAQPRFAEGGWARRQKGDIQGTCSSYLRRWIKRLVLNDFFVRYPARRSDYYRTSKNIVILFVSIRIIQDFLEIKSTYY